MEEILPVFWPYYAITLSLALVFGAVAQRTRFCLQGGLRDLAIQAQPKRIATFLAAMAFAALISSLLEMFSLVDLHSTRPNYRSSDFAYGRYLIGGLIFGYGMVLAAGCGFRQVIKSGEGSIKALWALSVMALTIFAMTRGEFFGNYLLPPLSHLSISFNGPQDFGSLISKEDSQSIRLFLAALFCVAVCWRINVMRLGYSVYTTAILVGLIISAGYLLTSGEYAQFLADEAAFMTTPPSGLGGQSFTVAAPLGDTVYFLNQRSISDINFGVLAICGLFIGSIISAVFSGRFSLQGFNSWPDFFKANIGAVFAGAGAVIAMGCSVGHGLTGLATLSLGSLLAFGGIVVGGSIAIKQVG